ncbi:glycosyltransferase [Ancylobacter lacus]|uniref:glycosyltransferase n=1 Tax=Ancylobacter lacus TaxID=2579970 RepID=UPI001BD1037D|nr:glycosyltransferase [Ancylobacter lacus]
MTLTPAPAGGPNPARRPRIAIVSPIIARLDAISLTAIETGRALAEALDAEVRYFTGRSDFPELKARRATGPVDLLTDPFFVGCDVAVFEFGVFAPLFDTLLLSHPHRRHIVRFHNITPPELMPPADRESLTRAWEQVHLLREADLVWACSPVNAQVARDHGVAPERLVLSPLAVEEPPRGTLAAKLAPGRHAAGAPIEMLFLGRIVASKGVLDLVQALGRLAPRLDRPIRLRIAGNMEWSPADYVARVRAAVAESGLADSIEFLGTVTDAERAALYARAHLFVLPSYHEGFCKPVVEALRAGCLPVTYDAYNLAFIAGGHGRLAKTGDVEALAQALFDVLAGLDLGEARTDAGTRSLAAHDAAVDAYVGDFSPEQFRRTVAEGVRRVMAQPGRAGEG